MYIKIMDSAAIKLTPARKRIRRLYCSYFFTCNLLSSIVLLSAKLVCVSSHSIALNGIYRNFRSHVVLSVLSSLSLYPEYKTGGPSFKTPRLNSISLIMKHYNSGIWVKIPFCLKISLRRGRDIFLKFSLIFCLLWFRITAVQRYSVWSISAAHIGCFVLCSCMSFLIFPLFSQCFLVER